MFQIYGEREEVRDCEGAHTTERRTVVLVTGDWPCQFHPVSLVVTGGVGRWGAKLDLIRTPSPCWV